MKFILKKYLLATASIYILMQIVPAVSIEGSWQGLFFSSFILAILFFILRPIVNLLLLPINFVTLNLSAWILQIVTFYIWTLLLPQIKIASWHISGFQLASIAVSEFNLVKWQATIVASFLFIIVNKFLNWVFR